MEIEESPRQTIKRLCHGCRWRAFVLAITSLPLLPCGAQQVTAQPQSNFPAFAAPSTAPSNAALPSVERQQTRIEGLNFVHPSSMRLTKVAGEPLIRWPIAADWTTDGDLLVLESNWNGETVEQQLQSKPHRIVRLTDQDDDGSFDQRTVIADQLSFSAGLLVHRDAIFVAAPPSILKLTDSNGDGFFDHRETWYDGGTLTYCANDLHGPFLGPDGWIYWTKGAFAEQQYKLLSGQTLTSKAAHLLRRHPDGGPVDILMSGGMDNPVDVAFLPTGEAIFCSTFMHHPGDGLRDGIGHAVYGSLFGKSHNPIENFPRTGPLMKPLEELGPAAPAALLRPNSTRISDTIKFFSDSPPHAHTIISCQFNLQRLAIHQLLPAGGSFDSQSQELLSADRVDFHPVDCLEDRDGSLIVLDTGGWYDLCCPSSGTAGQIATGGIYRLELRIDRKKRLGSLLPGTDSSDDLHKSVPTVKPQVAKVWETAKMLVDSPDDEASRGSIIEALLHQDRDVQQAAAHLVSLYRWKAARPQLLALLDSNSPTTLHTARLAAQCLGRIGNADEATINTLLNSLEIQKADRTGDHSILYALIELDSAAALRKSLASDSARQQWAAMLVLDQKKQISPSDSPRIFQLVNSTDNTVKTQALALLSNNPQLAPVAIDELTNLWQSADADQLAILATVVQQWVTLPIVHQWVSTWLRDWQQLNELQKRTLIQIVSSVRGFAIPESWSRPLAEILLQDRSFNQQIAIALANVSWSQPRDQPLIASIASLATDNQLDLSTSLRIIRSLPDNSQRAPDNLAQLLVQGLSQSDSELANQCIAALAKLKLSKSQAAAVIARLKTIPPTRLQPIILNLLAIQDETIDETLLKELPTLQAADSLAPQPILTALQDRPREIQQAWKDAFENQMAAPQDIDQAVADFLANLPPGDPVEGHQVFRSQQAACVSCHQIGYVGGRIGPELTRIGRSRSREQLAEAILFPSARQEQSYRATRVLTVDGRLLNGLPISLTSTHLELATGVDQTKSIPLEEIERQEPSPVSLMPAGLEKSLTPKQFADLLAFLQAAR